MKHKEIEYKLHQELQDIAPNMLDELLQAYDSNETAAEIINISNAKNPIKWAKVSSLVAVLAIVLTVAFTNLLITVQSCTVAVDVNPSLELCVNGFRRVTDVKYNNADAEELFADCNLEKLSIYDAMKTVTSKLCSSGYISDEHNGMLLSVSSRHGKYADELCDKLVDSIGDASETSGNDCAILYQAIDRNDTVPDALRNVPQGKAVLISKIDAMTQDFSIDEIKQFSVQELMAIVVGFDRLPDSTRFFGGLKGYYDIEAAEKIAEEDAFKGADKTSKSKLISYGEQLAYEVVVKNTSSIVEYVISATTGKILSIDKIYDNSATGSSKGGSSTGGSSTGGNKKTDTLYVISPSEAISRFIKANGFLLSDISDILNDISITSTTLHGVDVYKITFELNGQWQTFYVSKQTAENIDW